VREQGAYWKGRALDLLDVAPLSVTAGWGASVSARITPFFHTGLGFYDAWGIGMAPGRWGPRWVESGAHLLLISTEAAALGDDDYWYRLEGVEELPFSWPGGPDQRYEAVPGGTRHVDSFFFVRPISWNPIRPRPVKLPPWWGWTDADCHAFFGAAGLRIGIAPAQIVDFLLGWFGVDPCADDPIPSRDEEVIRGLAAVLADQGRSTHGRRRAALELARLGEDAAPAAPVILGCVRDDRVGRLAARVLIRIGTPALVAVQEALRDPSGPLYSKARIALNFLKPRDASAVPVLVALLLENPDPVVGMHAADLLGHMAATDRVPAPVLERAVPALERAAESSDVELRRHAKWALDDIRSSAGTR
jgi:hypothetical protein